jgi:hypothetical protein
MVLITSSFRRILIWHTPTSVDHTRVTVPTA